VGRQSNKKWKPRLLSSGVPLEHELSRLLTENGFDVSADFAYERLNSLRKLQEFSVDILATRNAPLRDGDRQRPSKALHLLVECKECHDDKAWLFFPVISSAHVQARTISDNLIRCGDRLSPVPVKTQHREFGRTLAICAKSVEIDLKKGVALESPIREGIAQLQYSLPHLLAKLVRTFVKASEPSPVPYFTAVLMTSAPLYVLKQGVGRSEIRNADKLDDIASRADYLAVYRDTGPQFERHYRRTIRRELPNLPQLATELGPKFKMEDQARRKLAERDLRYLAELRDWPAMLFRQFVVCHNDAAAQLLSDLDAATLAPTS